ncbi:MAG TPA: hypothetical protein VHV30_08255 [Polyangiaceae bacterium]|jgi:hypothetical protein|nr:hypothetical protein [Polyangiaceae bacterium]
MRKTRVAALAAGLTGLAALALPGAARADEKTACIEAHEHGQEVRLASHWLEARRLFLACAQPACPPLVVQDCTRWEEELAQHTPSVVVSAKRSDGSDVEDVALFIDGARFASRLPAVPIPLDPGDHVLRFERAGARAVERTLTLRDGERDRAVQVRFEVPAAGGSVASADARPARVVPWIAAGVGAAAAVASIALLVTGKTSEHDLAASACGRAGTCADAQVAPIRADYVGAGVTAGVAAVAVGIALWQFLAPGSHAARSQAWSGRIAF